MSQQYYSTKGVSGHRHDQAESPIPGTAFFSRENIKNVLIYSPVGICIISQNRIIDWANPACYAMTGHEYGHLEGKPVQTLYPTEKEAKRVDQVFTDGIQKAGTAITETRLLRIDGTAFDCRVRACWLDPADYSQGLLVTVSDITEIKSAQIRENQIQKMEAVSVLAGGVSHDFNNLLMGLQGHLSLMRINLNRPEKIGHHIQQMARLVETAAELTGRLLGFARGGKYQVDTLDINQVVNMALNIFQPERKNLVIQKKLASDLHKVVGDHSQLEQVLLNLMVNGAQAMVDGGTLTLETRNMEILDTHGFHFQVIPGPYVEILVKDTGIGMDEVIQKKVFDPFFSTKDPGDRRGRGLGLSTVFGIVKNHGGFITVESEKNVGSVFRVALPCELPMDAEYPLKASDEFDLMPKGMETVLLVDDEEEVIEVGSRFLEALGYQVIQARNGKECLDLLELKAPRIPLVILDLIMPVMDGKEAFKRIRAQYPEVKVLIFTGFTMDEEVKALVSEGCHGFLQKPFSMDRFSKAIRALLDRPVS